jgi:hypothetical protein
MSSSVITVRNAPFDAIMKKYNLSDPALQRLAIIVRGATQRRKISHRNAAA